MEAVYLNYAYPKQSQVKKDDPGFFKKSYAATVGSTVGGIVTTAVTVPATLKIMDKMVKVNRSVSKADVAVLNKAGEEILKTSGLASKGVKILHELPSGEARANILFTKEMCKHLPKKLGKFVKMMNPFYQFKLGRNAFFDLEKNTAMVSNKISLSQFHELGHAMNKYSKFGRFMQNMRIDLLTQRLKAGRKVPVAGFAALIAASTIPLIALYKNKKAKGEKAHGFLDKTTTFIKDNVGKLTFLTALPIAIEEGMASFKGEQFAKKFLNPELLKKVKFNNRLGLATYTLGAIALGVGAYVASKVRDKIVQPNLNKA